MDTSTAHGSGSQGGFLSGLKRMLGGAQLFLTKYTAMFRAEMPLEFATVKGIKNLFFGDSLFLAELHGPGHVWLPVDGPAKLAAAIEPSLPDKSSDNT